MSTKNIEVAVRFTNGSTLVALAPVDKSKYTSLQSKSCTYKNTLQAGILTKKYTAEEATDMWNKNVRAKWNSLVEPALRADLPEDVLNSIDSIAPNSGMLDFDAAGTQESAE